MRPFLVGLSEVMETFIERPFQDAMLWLSEIVPQIEATIKNK